MNDSNWRVYIDKSFRVFDSIGIWLINRQMYNGASTTCVAKPMEIIWEPHVEGTMLPPSPSLLLPLDLGRELSNGLVGVGGNTDEIHALRRDYEDERKRVDRLIGYLIK